MRRFLFALAIVAVLLYFMPQSNPHWERSALAKPSYPNYTPLPPTPTRITPTSPPTATYTATATMTTTPTATNTATPTATLTVTPTPTITMTPTPEPFLRNKISNGDFAKVILLSGIALVLTLAFIFDLIHRTTGK